LCFELTKTLTRNQTLQHIRVRCEIIAIAPVIIIVKSTPYQYLWGNKAMFLQKPLFVLIAMSAIMLTACDDSKDTLEDAADTTMEAVEDAADATTEAAEDAADAVKEAAE
jgi:hypothetical protein